MFNDLDGCDTVIFSLFWKMSCRKVFSSQHMSIYVCVCVCVCYVGIDKEQFIEELLQDFLNVNKTLRSNTYCL